MTEDFYLGSIVPMLACSSSTYRAVAGLFMRPDCPPFFCPSDRPHVCPIRKYLSIFKHIQVYLRYFLRIFSEHV
jgi:hypothetical protein